MIEASAGCLGERVLWDRVPGGLVVYVMPRRRWRRCSVLLTVAFGAVDTALWLDGVRAPLELPAGVAHFLEHRLFEKAAGDITERFGAQGAEVDADTAFTHTGFSCSCRSEVLPAVLDLLFELAFTVRLDAASVTHERRIIAHEIRLVAELPEEARYFQALATVFPGTRLAQDIAGTEKSLERIDGRLLRVCHEAVYRAANAALFVCGDVEAEAVLDWAAQSLRRYPQATAPASARLRRRVLRPRAARRRTKRMSVARPFLTLAFGDPCAGSSGPALLRREMALEMALHALYGPGSALCARAHEAGLIERGSFGFEANLEPAFGTCLLGGETPAPAELERALLATLDEAHRSGLDPADFELARRRMYGNLVRVFDSPELCVEGMQSAVSCGAGPLDFLTVFPEVTLAEAEACMRSFLVPAACGVATIVPDGWAAGT